MKAITKYSLCALVSIGLSCSTQAKQDDEKEQKDKEKSDKVEAVENKGQQKKDEKENKEKKDKVPTIEEVRGGTTPTDKPFSVPDAGSTVTLLGLSLAAVGLAHRRWKASPAQRP